MGGGRSRGIGGGGRGRLGVGNVVGISRRFRGGLCWIGRRLRRC